MEHVAVDLSYAAHDDFRAITRMADWSETFGTADQFWGAGGPLSREWAERVEQTPSFRTALRHAPLRLGMTHTPV